MMKVLARSLTAVLILTLAGCAKPSAFRVDGVPTEKMKIEDLGLQDPELTEAEIDQLEHDDGAEDDSAIEDGGDEDGNQDASAASANAIASQGTAPGEAGAPGAPVKPLPTITQVHGTPQITEVRTGPSAPPQQHPASGQGSAAGSVAPVRQVPAANPSAPSSARSALPTVAAGSASATGWRAVVGIAKWVIKNEADRVGKACNRFVQRVFERMGFAKGSWTANEFDKYVARSFSSYKVRSFSQPNPLNDRQALEQYLWSFPEGTGFVFQWKRQGPHGHIGFVQRIKDKLVIYHASLNRFKPKEQQTTIEDLLYKGGSKNQLFVYSHFQNGK